MRPVRPADRLIGMELSEVPTHITVRGPDECHPWTGGKTNGYGSVRIDGRTQYVHRLIFEHAYGPIPPGLVVDHTCHNADPRCVQGPDCLHRACENARHMEATTRGQNRSRAPIAGVAKAHAAQTECIHHHPLAPDNLMNRKDGARVCKICAKRRRDAHRAKGR